MQMARGGEHVGRRLRRVAPVHSEGGRGGSITKHMQHVSMDGVRILIVRGDVVEEGSSRRLGQVQGGRYEVTDMERVCGSCGGPSAAAYAICCLQLCMWGHVAHGGMWETRRHSGPINPGSAC